MAGKIDTRLKELGITLPDSIPPAANYVPWVRTGNLLFISGQVPAMHWMAISIEWCDACD